MVTAILEKIRHGFGWMTGRNLTHEKDTGKSLPTGKKVKNFKVLSILALIALIVQSGLLFLALFEPGLPYRVSRARAEPLDSPQFIRTLEALTGAHLHNASRFEVLTNGENYYPSELAAIQKATKTINLEAYIFARGEVADRFIAALTERARAGVRVSLLIDAIGAFSLPKSRFQLLMNAGGEVEWYHPLRWNTWPRLNNRTHRELLIIDGNVGFIGGAGWADHWLKDEKDEVRWRDTMVKVEGSAVTGLQSVFAENWLEASGEVLIGREYFPFAEVPQTTTSLVVGSTPTTGRSTNARVLFQTLLASANHSIYITTPYFLPDTSARAELKKAIKERHVDVRIVVPSDHTDHLLVRGSSRRLYGELLEAGAKIYEYKPAMTHTKSLVVDAMWGVVGSTNFDSRSFGINDEVNLAVLDRPFAARLSKDFWEDVSQSREVTYDVWKRRPLFERAHEAFGSFLERQQ